MRSRLIILIFLLCIAENLGYAQRVMTAEQAALSTGGRMRIYEGIYREGIPELIPWNLTDPVTLDNSLVVVKYDADIRLDTLTTHRAKDQALTLIGPKIIMNCGLWFWWDSVDVVASFGKKEQKPYFEALLKEFGECPSGYTVMINWFIYRDLKAKTILNKHALPLRKNSIEYIESLPKMSWTISEETKDVLGYDCQKAETDFRGRHWTVWFAPDIPVDCGFWKFSGLPGLILSAESKDGFFNYTAVSIENKEMKIQSYPKVETSRKAREQFRTMESSIFANPIIGGFLHQKNGQEYLMGAHLNASNPKETDAYIFTPNNYLGLYFPMELE